MLDLSFLHTLPNLALRGAVPRRPTMMTPLGYATLGLYGTSVALYATFLYVSKRWIGRAATVLLIAAAAVHWQALLERARALDAVPYQDLVGSMSLFAWLLAVTYLGVETYHRQRSAGPFILACVILLMVVAALITPETPPPAPARGALFALHVTLNILAYAAFTLSFVMSVIYLLQNRVLRDHRLGNTFWRFPPLEVLERMSRTSVMVGVAAMAVGTILGFTEAAGVWKGAWRFDAKVIVSVLTLGVYVGYLLLSRSTAWRGARASVVCVLSFLMVVFSYTVVNLFLSQHHRYF